MNFNRHKYQKQLAKAVGASCKELGLQLSEEEFKQLLDVETLFGIISFINGKTYVDTGNYKSEHNDPLVVKRLVEETQLNGQEDLTYPFVEDFIDSTFDERYVDYETLREIIKMHIYGGRTPLGTIQLFNRTDFVKRMRQRKVPADKLIGKMIRILREEYEADFYESPTAIDTRTREEITKRIKNIALHRR
jgi:hypothetical protein